MEEAISKCNIFLHPCAIDFANRFEGFIAVMSDDCTKIMLIDESFMEIMPIDGSFVEGINV